MRRTRVTDDEPAAPEVIFYPKQHKRAAKLSTQQIAKTREAAEKLKKHLEDYYGGSADDMENTFALRPGSELYDASMKPLVEKIGRALLHQDSFVVGTPRAHRAQLDW